MRPKKETPLTWSQLAGLLGVSARSVANWRKIDGAPTGTNQGEWESFVVDKNLGSAGKHSSLEELKAERIRGQIEIDRIKIERERKLTISAEELNDFLLTLANKAKNGIYAVLETELPPKLDGQDVTTIRRICRESADSICDRLKDGFDEWTANHETE